MIRMVTKKLLIGSLQYSPIYKSHCCALGKECKINGYQIKYLFSKKYEWMLPPDIKKESILIGNSKDIISSIIEGLNIKNIFKLNQIICIENPDYIYMYNYNPFLNYYLAILARKNKVKFIQHVQEPSVENKKIYGGFKQYRLYLFEFFQGMLLKKTDVVVLSSKIASNRFGARYKSFKGKIITIPLIYEDLGISPNTDDERQYITFIGPPVPSKSPEIFLKIIDYSEKYKLGFQFLLISRNKINNPSYFKASLKIIYKNKITDEEIGYYLKRSLMVVTPYKAATQSSVILTSYMYGTPVISSNVGGLPEVVEHLETGYLLSKDSSIEQWINGIMFIKNNFKYLSANCRNYFTANFSELNWPKYFKELFNQ